MCSPKLPMQYQILQFCKVYKSYNNARKQWSNGHNIAKDNCKILFVMR